MQVLEKSMLGKHLVITCKLTVNTQKIPTDVLIDCGATGVPCMDPDFSCHQMIPLRKLKVKCQVEVIDGRPLVRKEITHITIVGW